MSVMVKEIFEAFVEAGTSEEKAKAAAGVVPVTDNLATKADLAEHQAATKTDLAEHRAATKADLAELQMATKEDMAKMELRLVRWMVSLQLTTLVLLATFIKFL